MNDALITPQIIVWARERVGLRQDELADGITTAEKLAQWENGFSYPTVRQARQLAKKTHIPFGYLYLSSPPNLQFPMADFRSDAFGNISPKDRVLMHELLQSYQSKLSWMDEYYEEESVNFNSSQFLGKSNVTDNPLDIAAEIRQKIPIPLAGQRGTVSDFLRGFIRSCEQFGIWVVRTGFPGRNNNLTISPNAYRGFAMKSAYRPLVWLNSGSYASQKVFTLAHELTHLWLGSEGATNFNPDSGGYNFSNPTDDKIENLCDQVATEILIPSSEFESVWDATKAPEWNIEFMHRFFRTSRFVVLNKAFSSSRIDFAKYKKVRSELIQRIVESDGSGGNFYRNMLLKNGFEFSKAVQSRLLEGEITYQEAFSLLDIKTPDTLSNYFNFVDQEKEKESSDDISLR